jgi:hypothetical protein
MSGYAALRTIIPMAELKVDVPRDSVLLWGGPGYHVIHYPLRHGSEFNIVAVFRTTHADKADIATCRTELERIYRDAHHLRFTQSRALAVRRAMSLRSRCAADTIARFIALAMKPNGGKKRVSIRPSMRVPCGYKHIRCRPTQILRLRTQIV